MRRSRHIGWLVVLLLFVTDGASAQAFPFRSVAKGEPLPPVSVVDASGKPVALNAFKKEVTVFLFFGADSAFKKRHAVTALRKLTEEMAGFGDRVAVVPVDVQDDPPETVTAVAEAAGYTGTVYRDAEKKVYKALGLYVMPCVLIAKSGKIAAGFGYTHNFSDLVKGEVEILLGLKTREAVEAALHPKTVEKSAQEKEALRYYNLGRSMMRKGLLPQAEEAFAKALTADAGFFRALLGMAEVALQRGEVAKAAAFLGKAEAIDPNALETVLVSAKVLAAEKKVDEALAKVAPLALTHPRSEAINRVLGHLYEQKGDLQKAVRYYKKALVLCGSGE